MNKWIQLTSTKGVEDYTRLDGEGRWSIGNFARNSNLSILPNGIYTN